MWEYKRKDIRFRLYSELLDELNNAGGEGWEIIYYIEEKPDKFGNEFFAKVLYKRQKPPVCQQ